MGIKSSLYHWSPGLCAVLVAAVGCGEGPEPVSEVQSRLRPALRTRAPLQVTTTPSKSSSFTTRANGPSGGFTGTNADVEAACPCNGPFVSHTQYVNCATAAANTLDQRNLVTPAERDAIIQSASDSSCGNVNNCPTGGGMTSVGSLATARVHHSSTVLNNSGFVLVIGGADSTGTELASAELYDPLFATWSSPASLTTARFRHTATKLDNDRILVAGGYRHDLAGVFHSELFVPNSQGTTGSFQATGDMVQGRNLHTATKLDDGRVLIVGGYAEVDNTGALLQGRYDIGVRILSSAEIYDPSTGTFSSTGSLAAARNRHSATLLNDGRVLIAGGVGLDTNGTGTINLASTEIYDPTTGTFSAGPDMKTARRRHTAFATESEARIIFSGGSNSDTLATGEAYSVSANSFSAFSATMQAGRDGHGVARLNDGDILQVGGANAGGVLASIDVFDPATDTYNAGPTMLEARDAPALTLLQSACRVVISGGSNHVTSMSSTELYWPCDCNR